MQQPLITTQFPLAVDLIVIKPLGKQALGTRYGYLRGALAAVIEARVQLALAVEHDDIDVLIAHEQPQHLLVHGLFVVALLRQEIIVQLLCYSTGLLAFQVALKLSGSLIKCVFR